MKIIDVGTVVATRELNLSVDETVAVLVGKPEKSPDAEDDYCWYQLIGLGNERVRRAGGVGAVQALELALKMIGTDLYTSKESQTGELSWSRDDIQTWVAARRRRPAGGPGSRT